MNKSVKLNESDHRQGNKDAPIILMEYGDYECPHCGVVYPVIKKLQRHFASELLFVYRNFPLSDIHPYAVEAASAAEAAAIQGKFWPMHDLIFENQQTLSSRQLLNFGRVIGLQIDGFVADMKSAAVRDKLENDIESGIWSGVHGTPSLFINGIRYEDYPDYESMKQAIDILLT